MSTGASRVVRASELVGRDVFSIAEGEKLAAVKDIVFDADGGQVLGFTLNSTRKLGSPLRQVLTAADIHAVGPDAVMVDEMSKLHEPAGAADQPLAGPPPDRDVLGVTVLTDDGTRLGAVADVILSFEGGQGTVVGYELVRDNMDGRWFVPRPAQRAVSGDALVVPSDVEDLARTDDTGLGAIVHPLPSQGAAAAG